MFLCKNYKYTILFSRPGIRDTAELPFLLFPRPHTLSPFTILDAVGTKAGRKKEKKSGNNPDGIDYFTSRATPLSASFFFQPPEGAERRGAPDDRKYVYCIYSQVFSFNFRHHLRCLKLLKNGRKDWERTSVTRILRPETGVLLRGHASALRLPAGCGHVGRRDGRSDSSSSSSAGAVVMMVVATGVRRRRRRRVGPPFARQAPLILLLAPGLEPQRIGRRRLARKLEGRRLKEEKRKKEEKKRQ